MIVVVIVVFVITVIIIKSTKDCSAKSHADTIKVGYFIFMLSGEGGKRGWMGEGRGEKREVGGGGRSLAKLELNPL